MMDSKTVENLRREFDYVPNEGGDERWVIFDDKLIVIHRDRPPRVYCRGGETYTLETDRL